MFTYLMKKAGKWFADKQKPEEPKPEKQKPEEPKPQDKSNDAIPLAIDESLKKIKAETCGSSDVVVRSFSIGANHDIDCALVFIDGMISSQIINDDVIKPLLFKTLRISEEAGDKDSFLDFVQKSLLSVNELKETKSLGEAVGGLLSGDVVLFVDGIQKAVIMNSKGWEKRSVSEPASESVVRGPRESFIENLRTNTALLRRKITNSNLVFESMTIGRKTATKICLAYIKNVAQPELVNEVRSRMSAIDTDSILESGYVEQFIEDSPGSIFATIGYSEKPDVVAAKLLEGRVAIIVDGTPFVLTAPYLFLESFQSAEDYYFRPYFATLLRFVRAIGYLTTILAPALYVAVSTFHQELIPTRLLITAAAAREGVPFPAVVECLLMILLFEILREAGVRLPRPVGQALSIVGALVVGEAAVSAGLIGAPMVIVVAVTAVSGFVVPNQSDSAAILRLILLILAATFGGFGFTMGLLATLVHLSALESFGYPYLSPIAPFIFEDSKDTLIRAPLWMMISRPKGMATDRQRRRYAVPPQNRNNAGEGE
jgi:spore germination protein KA